MFTIDRRVTAITLIFLSVGAAASSQGQLSKLDSDGDGALNRAEFTAMQEARFAQIDADGDGGVSVDEMLAASKGKVDAARAEQMISRLDQDGDGLLSFDERFSRRDMFARLDADGDGLLSREEMRAGRGGERPRRAAAE